MAAQSLRSRRHPHRIHGIHARPTTVLLRVYWAASETMSCLFSCSRIHLFRKFCSLICAIIGCCSVRPARAQNLDKPLSSIDDEITAFSFGPDGGIAFSVYHNFKTKKYDLEHDDIWVQDARGKRRRLLEGQKYTRGNQLISYLTDSI